MMTSPSRRRTAIATLVAVIAVGGLAASPAHADSVQSTYYSATSTGTLGNGAAPGGTVTRQQVIDRAKDWKGKVPYSTNGLNSPYSWWSDSATGGRYRQDCSGFISMAWQLPYSRSTGTLPEVATQISRSDLKPGDILDDTAEHVVLFAGWKDKSANTFYFYAESGRGVLTQEYVGDLDDSTLQSHPTSAYRAYRYNKIVDGGTIPGQTPPADPTASAAVATLTSPSASNVVSGEIQLTMSVTETVGTPSEGTFYVDGSRIASVDDDAHTYSATLDTAELDDGPHTLTVSAKNSDSKNGPVSAGVPLFVANKATASTAMGDFNGDGKDDVAVLYQGATDSDTGVNHTALWTFTSNGTGFNNPVRAWESVTSGTGSWNWSRSKPVVGDFNGDGKADLAVLYKNGRDSDGVNHTALWTFTSNGTGFNNPVRNWESVDAGTGSWDWDRSKPVVGDFNGDGKADVAVLYNNGAKDDGYNHTALWTFTSNGTGFANPVRKWESVDAGTGSWNWDRSKAVAGDFNGDGKADVGVLYDNGQDSDGANHEALWTFTSTGSGFNNPVRKWESVTSGTGSWDGDRTKAVAGDFNGDGKADVAVLYNNGAKDDGYFHTALWTFTSNGTGFNNPVRNWENILAGTGSWNWDRSKLTSGDFNGDGKSDIGVLYNNGAKDDGYFHTALWTFTGNGTGFANPVRNWENIAAGSGSWNWDRSDLG